MITFLGLPNVFARGSFFITAPSGPEPVGGEASNLKTNEPTQTARILSTYPKSTIWNIQSYFDYFDLDGIAIDNHNLTENGYVRISNGFVWNSLGVSSIIASTNLTGVVANVQEAPTSPDSNYVGPTTTSSQWSATFNFPNAPVTVVQGLARSTFVTVIDLFGTPTNAYPTITVELRENGNLVRSMGTKAINLNRQTLVWPFNPAELASPSVMTNLEVKVIGNPGDAGSYVKLNSLECLYESSLDPGSVDSGWISVNQNQFFTSRDGVTPTKSIHVMLSNTVTHIDNVAFWILDDGTELNPPSAQRYANPNAALISGMSRLATGYIEAGMLIGGTKLSIVKGITAGSSQPKTSVNTTMVSGLTGSGQSYGADAFTKRDLSSLLELICTRDEMMNLMSKIGWQKGHSGVFYVILEPDVDLKYQLFSSFAAVCTEIQSYPLETGRTPGSDRSLDEYYVVLGLAEKL